MQIKTSVFWRIMPFILLLFLVACSGDDDGSANVVAGSNQASSTEASSESSANINTTDANTIALDEAYTRIDNQLAVVRGQTLEINALDGSAPQSFSDVVVKAASLSVPTNSNAVLFNAGSTRFRLHRLNADDMVVEQVVRVSGEYAFAFSFSPNQEWVIIGNFPNLIAGRTDGSDERFTLGPIFATTAFWLDNNQLLVIDNQAVANGGASVASIVDPESRETVEIDETTTQDIINLTINSSVPTDTVEAQEIVFAGFGVNLAYAPQAVEDIQATITLVPPPAGTFGSAVPICDTWQVQRLEPDGTTETLYVSESTLFLNNVMQTADGDIFVEHWYLENCDNNRRTVDLLHITPEGEVTRVLQGLDNGVGTNYGFWFGDNANRTALSPDGAVIAWLGGGLDAGFSTLNLYFVEDNSTVEIERVERTSNNASTFHITDAFTGIVWLP